MHFEYFKPLVLLFMMLLAPLLELGAVVSKALWEELSAKSGDLQRFFVIVIHNLLETDGKWSNSVKE